MTAAVSNILYLGLWFISPDDGVLGCIDLIEYPVSSRHECMRRPREAGDGRRAGNAKQSGQE
jgi:hypothetical protein